MPFTFRGDRARAGEIGPPGAPGAPGKSAYQIAVENGFVGTEAQWLASLVGPVGPASTVPGPAGDDGAAATITVASTTTLAAGSPATVTNAGTSSAASLAFGIPKGADGTNGANGSAATITVASTTTGAAGTNASVTNSGTSSAAALNFTIPRGDTGPIGPTASPATPNARTLAFATAYQAATASKPAFVSVTVEAFYPSLLIAAYNDVVELRIGPTAATVADGTGGYQVATWRLAFTAVVTLVGSAIGGRGQLSAMLPTGWYFAVRRVSGTVATINSGMDQSLG